MQIVQSVREPNGIYFRQNIDMNVIVILILYPLEEGQTQCSKTSKHLCMGEHIRTVMKLRHESINLDAASASKYCTSLDVTMKPLFGCTSGPNHNG